MKDDNKLKEPGAGWRNDLIESAHLRNAMGRDESSEATKDRDWILGLKHPPEKKPSPCRHCGTMTTLFWAGACHPDGGQNIAVDVALAICADCHEKLSIWKMKRSLATAPQLLPHLRESYTQQIVEYEKEHGEVPYKEQHHGPA